MFGVQRVAGNAPRDDLGNLCYGLDRLLVQRRREAAQVRRGDRLRVARDGERG